MNDDGYGKLIELLKLFKNRPHHLAKYLLDNNALNDDFMKTISNSGLLTPNESIDVNHTFISISQIEEFYKSLTDIKNDVKKTPEEIEAELNNKLDDLIRSEKYEDASRLRDYMNKQKIKRITKF
jgi:hypothetical protein